MPITSPVERISGPSAGSTSGNRLNGITASLTATCPPTGSRSTPSARSSASVAPSITRVATFASETPGRLGDERHGAARPRVGLDHVDRRAHHGVLDVDQAAHVEVLGDRRGVRLDHLDHPRRQRRRRERTRRVARVHAGFLDVFHHAADQHLAGVVADGVDVDLGRIGEEPVDQHRTLGRQPAFLAEAAEPGELLHRPGEVVAVVDDLHRPTAEHVARTHQHREADLVGDRQRLFEVDRRATRRLRDLQLVADRVPALAVLGGVDRVGRGAGDEFGRDQAGQLQRGLPAERHDDRLGLLDRDDVQHVLLRQRLEVQTGSTCRSRSTRSRGCS